MFHGDGREGTGVVVLKVPDDWILDHEIERGRLRNKIKNLKHERLRSFFILYGLEDYKEKGRSGRNYRQLLNMKIRSSVDPL